MTSILPNSAPGLPGNSTSFSTSALRHGLRHASRPVIPAAFVLLMLLSSIGRPALAQAIPAAEASPVSTGFELPRTAGSMQYSISANESLSTGFYGNSGWDSATGLNGNLALISASKEYPFSMVFSGGRSWTTSAQPSTTFLNLGLSQVINTRNWNFVLSDSVSYLPQTPSTGLSGIPGVGDLGVPPVNVGIDYGQGLLTEYATRVNNAVSLSAQRRITGKTSLQLNGTYSTLDFLGNSGNNGYNSTGESGGAGLSHRIDARNTVGVNYAYSRYSYGASHPGLISQTASMQYTRQFTRRLSMDLSAGPQWTNSTNSGLNVPTSYNLFANVAINYSVRTTNLSLAYSRGTNSGFGVIQGARSDSVNIRASRTFATVWSGAASSAYTRTTALAATGGSPSFAPTTLVESAQLSRAIARSLSAYASYTFEKQSTTSTVGTTGIFGGSFQVVTFGMTYSPNLIHFGPR